MDSVRLGLVIMPGLVIAVADAADQQNDAKNHCHKRDADDGETRAEGLLFKPLIIGGFDLLELRGLLDLGAGGGHLGRRGIIHGDKQGEALRAGSGLQIRVLRTAARADFGGHTAIVPGLLTSAPSCPCVRTGGVQSRDMLSEPIRLQTLTVDMRPVLDTLAEWSLTVPAFVPNMPGFGCSPGPAESLGMEDLAGNSMGCQIVLALARCRPERVGGLVLAGAAVGGQSVSFWRYALGLMRESGCIKHPAGKGSRPPGGRLSF